MFALEVISEKKVEQNLFFYTMQQSNTCKYCKNKTSAEHRIDIGH